MLKHYVKVLLGRPDPNWDIVQFEKAINRQTKRQRKELLAWAQNCLAARDANESPERYEASDDPVVQQGYALRRQTLAALRGACAGFPKFRILIHVPPAAESPAGHSLFSNFLAAFRFVGIEARDLGWDEPTGPALGQFNPSVLLTSDSRGYLDRVDWRAVAEYRRQHPILTGLTASLEEYGNSPLPPRIRWAREHGVDFYYTFRDADYVRQRRQYDPFREAGYAIVPLMFGANIDAYYPVPDIRRDLPYVFLGSQNAEKASRYEQFAGRIFRNYAALIDGPHWSFARDFIFDVDRDRYLYARAKVGVNIHLQNQIDYASEVNERVFMLAACGVPQLCDNAKLLDTLFSPGAIVTADSPAEYDRRFAELLADPAAAQRAALAAQKEVFERHTTLHRVRSFATALLEAFPQLGEGAPKSVS